MTVVHFDWDKLEHMSLRSKLWLLFALEVLDHVEGYTVPQYGDAPTDQITNWSLDDVRCNLLRYVNRIGKNQRGQVEADRDACKIAHYASQLWAQARNLEHEPELVAEELKKYDMGDMSESQINWVYPKIEQKEIAQNA